MNTRARFLIVFAISGLLFSALAFTVAGQRSKESDAESQWEYLIVAGPSNTNLSTSGNEQYSSMRKQPDSSFAREFFPQERNFDKLGAKGWELITIFGNPNDPIYYFKRRKETR